jgi:hypothetical protein
MWTLSDQGTTTPSKIDSFLSLRFISTIQLLTSDSTEKLLDSLRLVAYLLTWLLTKTNSLTYYSE